MKTLVVILFHLFLLAANQIAATAETADRTVPDLSFEKRCLLTRELQQKLNRMQENLQPGDVTARQVAALDLLNNPTISEISVRGLGSDLFAYYVAHLQVMAGKQSEGLHRLTWLANRRTVAPEVVDNFFEASALNSKEARRQHYLVLGMLLPISSFGRLSDLSRTDWMVDADQPVIPAFPPGRPEVDIVGDKYFEMKLYDRAVQSYLETIYGRFAPPRIRTWYWDSWLSQITSPLWLKAAQSEWQIGRPDDAANYIAKAIVFGSDATKDEALKTLEEWRQDGLPQKPPPFQLDAAKLKQIAKFYVLMNMHPRTIEILRTYEPVIGEEAKPLREKYEKEWLALVESYCFGTVDGKCVLFGQDVSRPENRLKVVIPPPLRKEALDAAVKTIRELSGEATTPATTPAVTVKTSKQPVKPDSNIPPKK